MSLASQVNEGDGRQLSETMMDHGSHLQAVSSETKEKEGRNDDTMDVELSVGKLNEASQSENENAGLKKKSGKKEPMEIEQHKQQAGGSGKKVRNTCKVDTDTQVDIHPPPLEFVATTSDGRTSRTSSEVLAFTGIGRTLSENGKSRISLGYSRITWVFFTYKKRKKSRFYLPSQVLIIKNHVSIRLLRLVR